jgi:hypothetical protein
MTRRGVDIFPGAPGFGPLSTLLLAAVLLVSCSSAEVAIEPDASGARTETTSVSCPGSTYWNGVGCTSRPGEATSPARPTARAAYAQVGGWLLLVPPMDDGLVAALLEARGTPDAPSDRTVSDADRQRAARLWDESKTAGNVAKGQRLLLEGLFETSAPLSRWRQLLAFDTAQACEREKRQAISRYQPIADKKLAQDLSADDLQFAGGVVGLQLGRCVPASAYYPRP